MHRLSNVISAYWVLFWGLNGLDKFCHSSDLILFRWHGKDRSTQFTQYFERLSFPQDYVSPFLYFVGIWEVLLALIFMAIPFYYHRNKQKLEQIATLNAATFLAFCGFDIIAGDRAELLEHSTYFILVVITFFVYQRAASQNASAPSTSSTA
ncbi:hypothetical protein [Kiloniella sp. EL199]|uniref:hypothetical protein n=1 Tax=Kiloniella sp. EL199 TaxID=2107581 RepID=UPI0013C4707F|nr:hypothetical protein [Kiloniella sp. EL199]